MNAWNYIPAGMSFKEAVAMGLVEGAWYVDKYGENPTITTSTDPETLWEYGGILQYSTTADIVSISSSDAGDTQTVSLTGQTADGTEVVQTATLDGQNTVTLATPLKRLYRMANSSGTPLSGFVYTYVGTDQSLGIPNNDSDVRAMISPGNEQTQMLTYTVPKGKVAFLHRGETGIIWPGGGPSASNQAATIQYVSRRPGAVWIVKKTFAVTSEGQSNYVDNRTFIDVVPALTDFELRVHEVSDTLGVWGTFDILLVDQEKLLPEFLAMIGQPS